MIKAFKLIIADIVSNPDDPWQPFSKAEYLTFGVIVPLGMLFTIGFVNWIFT